MKLSSRHRRHEAPHRSSRHRHSRRQEVWWRLSELPTNLLAIVILWIALLLLGGSSRGDVAQLIVLRPVAVMIAAYGFWTLRWQHIMQHRFLVVMAAAILLLTGVHLVPLPPELWMSLPGRALIIEMDRSLGLLGTWRPITMAPAFGWNALFALAIPLAVLVNGIQLSGKDLARIGPVVIAGGVASAVLAFFQLFGARDGILYFYSINIASPEAVGVFANRNHQALLIATMFPLLAAFSARQGISAAQDRRRLIVALALGVFLIPLLMVTGSRAGLVLGFVGLIAAPFIFARGARPWHRGRFPSIWWKYGVISVALLLVTGLLIAANRLIALQRVMDALSAEDQRYGRWSVIFENYGRFMPFGSGIGSYQPAFQTFEPRTKLTASYSNHAHNDWLEVLMTAGVPGAILLAIAAGAFTLAAVRYFSSKDRGAVPAYRFAGLTVVLLIAAASTVDYPVRTPLISALLIIACLWGNPDGRASIRSTELGDDRPN